MSTDAKRAELRRLIATIDAGEPLRRRAVQQAISEATAEHWRRRAAALEAAMPRPDDFNGQATPDELRARSERLWGAALACRQHAALLEAGTFLDDAWDQNMEVPA